jgi:glycerophosphoryl diester phosphodiesterase
MGKPFHLYTYSEAKAPFTVIGHRGACHYFPENTISSFQGAFDLGADMIEFDVQLTADGVPVVFHDEKLNRCTDGNGSIGELGLLEIKALDAGSWFDKKFSGEKIPTLEEVLFFCKDRIAANIEIKTESVTESAAGGIEEKCIQLVSTFEMADHVVFSSFDPRAIRHLGEIDPSIPTAALFNKELHRGIMPSELVRDLNAGSFNCSTKELNDEWLADCLREDIPVNVYTINDEKAMKRYLGLGVSGIFTNKPDILRGVYMKKGWKKPGNQPPQ